ncbi:MAG TPA: MAPEG family protein [Kofleriaceae bacterium]
MTLSEWIGPRRGSLISIVIGTASWVAAFALGLKLWPAGPVLATTADRLGYACQLLVGVSVLALLMVSACFRIFDTAGAENPLANAESPGWKVHQRVLQNTVEQSLIFVPALLALAVRIDAAHTHVLPLVTALWCAGRVLFWIGYRVKPVLRGPGFEWTLFSSLAALAWFVSTL